MEFLNDDLQCDQVDVWVENSSVAVDSRPIHKRIRTYEHFQIELYARKTADLRHDEYLYDADALQVYHRTVDPKIASFITKIGRQTQKIVAYPPSESNSFWFWSGFLSFYHL